MDTLSTDTFATFDQNQRSFYIDSNNIRQLLRGSTVLSGGGGGSFQEAVDNYSSRSPGPVEVRNLEEFRSDARIVTVFGLGPVDNNTENPLDTARHSVEEFQESYGEIDGILLGELGPDLIVEAVVIADELGVPLANADVAGMRAVPSIQNEIIEETDISRTPIIACNGDETVAIEEGTGAGIDQHIRQLAERDAWYVTGYSSSPEEFLDHAVTGWFEECYSVERPEITFLGSGTLQDVEVRNLNGHNVGRMVVEDEETFEVYFLNENLLVVRNGEVVSRAPDTISVIEPTGLGVYNGDIPDVGQQLEIYELSYSFWDEPESMNLESFDIVLEDSSIRFQNEVEFRFRGDLE